jgi:hypothetical protein
MELARQPEWKKSADTTSRWKSEKAKLFEAQKFKTELDQLRLELAQVQRQRVLRWDGTDWVIAGLVSDNATIMKQGKRVCDFQEALADAHARTKWLDCEFIYTYDGSTWGSA